MNQVEYSQFIIIHKSHLEICDQDACAAALLNFFSYWHEIRLEKLNNNSKNNSNNLLQWYTNEELQERLMIFCKKRIQLAIKKLVSLGLISMHRNPNPRYSFDNTKHFLFHPEQLNNLIVDTKEANASGEKDPNYEADQPIDKSEKISPNGSNQPNDKSDSIQSMGGDDPVYSSDRPKQYKRLHTRLLSEITNKNTPKNTNKKTIMITEDFVFNSAFFKFWELWKNLTGKNINQKTTQDIFNKLIKSESEELFKKIMGSLEQQNQARKIRDELNLFNPNWPNPDTWLKNARWNDEINLEPEKLKQEIIQNPKLEQKIFKQQREKFLNEAYGQDGDDCEAAYAKFEAELRAISAQGGYRYAKSY